MRLTASQALAIRFTNGQAMSLWEPITTNLCAAEANDALGHLLVSSLPEPTMVDSNLSATYREYIDCMNRQDWVELDFMPG